MGWSKSEKSGFSKRDPAQAIDAFWKFWASVKDRIAEGIQSAPMDPETIDAMGKHVAAIHPDLDWELGPGRVTAHHLCLSGKGDPVLRVVAERWRKRAPASDPVWEYYASRQPHRSPGLVLEIGGHRLELDQLACTIHENERRERLDLVLHHPLYPKIDERDLRVRIAFIGLDTLLGEDDVERWIGGIEVSDEPLEGTIPLLDLRTRIEAFRSTCTGDKWSVLKGEKDGKPIFVSRNDAVKRIDHLLLDLHVEIQIALLQPTDAGLTTNEEAETLNAMEDVLFESLGKEFVNIGRETHAGMRTMHLHVMEGGPAAQKIHAWKDRYPERRIEVVVRPDPRWEVLSRWG